MTIRSIIGRGIEKERSVATERLARLALVLIAIILFIMDIALAYLYVNASLNPAF